MKSDNFETLLKQNETDLRLIRAKYFPLISEGIITGYNVYPQVFNYSKGNL